MGSTSTNLLTVEFAILSWIQEENQYPYDQKHSRRSNWSWSDEKMAHDYGHTCNFGCLRVFPIWRSCIDIIPWLDSCGISWQRSAPIYSRTRETYHCPAVCSWPDRSRFQEDSGQEQSNNGQRLKPCEVQTELGVLLGICFWDCGKKTDSSPVLTWIDGM